MRTKKEVKSNKMQLNQLIIYMTKKGLSGHKLMKYVHAHYFLFIYKRKKTSQKVEKRKLLELFLCDMPNILHVLSKKHLKFAKQKINLLNVWVFTLFIYKFKYNKTSYPVSIFDKFRPSVSYFCIQLPGNKEDNGGFLSHQGLRRNFSSKCSTQTPIPLPQILMPITVNWYFTIAALTRAQT